MSRYSNLKVTTKNSEAAIEGEIPLQIVETYRKEALGHIQENFEISGFRKGQVPLDIVEKHVNAVYVLEEAADLAIQDIYPEIIVAENLKTLGRPQVTITKLAPGNPIGFSIRIGLVPDFSLADYKKIAQTIAGNEGTIMATDEEIDKTINQILELRKKQPTDPTPKLTDELAQNLGAFADAKDLREKVRMSIEEEKEHEARRARREAIAEKLAAETKMIIPQVLVEEELKELHHDRDEELRRANMTMETYLQNMNTTAEKLTEQERSYVERQIKTKFILQKIAEQEKIIATDIEIGDHVDALRRRHPEVDLERLRSYVRSMIVNEKVLELLEGTSGTSAKKPAPEKSAEKKAEKKDEKPAQEPKPEPKKEEPKEEPKKEEKPKDKKDEEKSTPKSGMVF